MYYIYAYTLQAWRDTLHGSPTSRMSKAFLGWIQTTAILPLLSTPDLSLFSQPWTSRHPKRRFWDPAPLGLLWEQILFGANQDEQALRVVVLSSLQLGERLTKTCSFAAELCRDTFIQLRAIFYRFIVPKVDMVLTLAMVPLLFHQSMGFGLQVRSPLSFWRFQTQKCRIIWELRGKKLISCRCFLESSQKKIRTSPSFRNLLLPELCPVKGWHIRPCFAVRIQGGFPSAYDTSTQKPTNHCWRHLKISWGWYTPIARHFVPQESIHRARGNSHPAITERHIEAKQAHLMAFTGLLSTRDPETHHKIQMDLSKSGMPLNSHWANHRCPHEIGYRCPHQITVKLGNSAVSKPFRNSGCYGTTASPTR